MKTDDLIDSIGNIDDKYLKSVAEARKIKKKSSSASVWKKWASLAAGLAVIVISGVFLAPRASDPGSGITGDGVVIIGNVASAFSGGNIGLLCWLGIVVVVIAWVVTVFVKSR